MATATYADSMAIQPNIAPKEREKEEKEEKVEKEERESTKLKDIRTVATPMVPLNRTTRKSIWEESLSGGRKGQMRASKR